MTNEIDAHTFRYVTRRLDDALRAKDGAGALEEFCMMYGKLREYRALRGRVKADDTLDDWVDALSLCVRVVGAAQLGARPAR